jgi:magnesium and cobalt transporter
MRETREGLGPDVGQITRFLLYPLLRLLRMLKKIVERLISRGGKISRSEMIEEELQTLIDDGIQVGAMDKEDEELLHSVIEFGDTLAREVMVPRMDMVAIELDTPVEKVLETVVEVGHTRLPVYRKKVDHVVGILHSKDLLNVWQSGKEDSSIRELLRPVIFLPEDERISVLLREMKKLRTHLAIAVDEFGGVAGLLTLEDLVEEIIGEVEDEFDHRENLFQEEDEGWLVDSRMGLFALAEKINLPESLLEKARSETVGGLMGELLGRLPRAGEEVSFGRYLFQVAKTDGRRVVKVKIREQSCAE